MELRNALKLGASKSVHNYGKYGRLKLKQEV